MFLFVGGGGWWGGGAVNVASTAVDKEVLDLSRPDEIIRVLVSLRVQGLQVLGWRASLHHPFHVGETQLNFLSCEPAQKMSQSNTTCSNMVVIWIESRKNQTLASFLSQSHACVSTLQWSSLRTQIMPCQTDTKHSTVDEAAGLVESFDARKNWLCSA